MKQVHKQYEKAFVLEPTKLGRIVDTIHERLADHPGTLAHDAFELAFTGNRREELASLEDVLAIDNSRRHRIRRLIISCTAATPGALRPEHEVQVDFAAPKQDGTSSNAKVVTITVRSDVAGWSSRTLSEVEEQVERTWFPRSGPLVVLVVLLVLVLVLVGSQFLEVRSGGRPESMWLSESDLDRVQTMLPPEHTLTDAEHREVVTMQLRNMISNHRAPSPPQPNQAKRTFFVTAPLLVVLACIGLLIATCYPSAVFLWGDEVERYKKIIDRRKLIWGVLISLTFVGILSKFLFEGIAMWLSR